MQSVSKGINMNFGLEKCARMCLKMGRIQSKMHIESAFENDIKEPDPRKAYKYLGIEESYDIQRENEKAKLKKDYYYYYLHSFFIDLEGVLFHRSNAT
jgi:hypothetical protein